MARLHVVIEFKILDVDIVPTEELIKITILFVEAGNFGNRVTENKNIKTKIYHSYHITTIITFHFF